ncbi:MAG: tetratricopeptide repeat protein, partial [Candidatus Sericytochromatia bacterium]|nr:tetratricopeptide repeat protein [Candidatus Tanganyikabacteria bacterium]
LNLGDLIAARSAEALTVLSVGDLQWADDASLDWLTGFFERTSACEDRLRLLITCEIRPDQRLRLHHAGDALQVTPIQLGPLAREEAEGLAAALLGRGRQELTAPSSAALDRILARSDGNPLFLAQLLADAVSSGEFPGGSTEIPDGSAPAASSAPGSATSPLPAASVSVASVSPASVNPAPVTPGSVTPASGSPASGPTAPVAPGSATPAPAVADLPDSMQAVAEARLKKLPGPVMRLVQVAAVLGRRFDRDLLAKLTDAATLGQIADGLRTGILVEDEDGRLRFGQAEFHEVAYQSMPPSLRKLLHLRAAEVLEAQALAAANDAVPWVHALAHHYSAAQDGPRAAAYLTRAGDHARNLGDFPRARDCYKAALGWIEKAPEAEGAGDLMLHLAIIEGDLGNAEDALNLLDRRAETDSESPRSLRTRAEILRRCGDLDRALAHLTDALAAGPEPDERALVLACQSDVTRLTGNFKNAIGLAQEALAALAALDGEGRKPATEGYVHSVLGICHHRMGNLGAARLAHSSALRLRESARDIAGCAISVNNIASIDMQQGRWEQADAGYRRSLDIARRLGDRRSIITALENLGDLLLSRGEEDAAEGHFREALRMAREAGSVGDEIICIANLATVRLARLDGHAALQEIEACRSLAELSAYAEYAADILCIQGKAHQLIGDLAAARRNHDQARGLAARSGNASLVAIVDRHLAELDLAEGKAEAALERATHSEAALRKATLPLELGRTLALLARIAPAEERERYRS